MGAEVGQGGQNQSVCHIPSQLLRTILLPRSLQHRRFAVKCLKPCSLKVNSLPRHTRRKTEKLCHERQAVCQLPNFGSGLASRKRHELRSSYENSQTVRRIPPMFERLPTIGWNWISDLNVCCQVACDSRNQKNFATRIGLETAGRFMINLRPPAAILAVESQPNSRSLSSIGATE